MSKQKPKKEIKIKAQVKKEDFVEDDENNKKSIILILGAIVLVLGLIGGSVFLFGDKPEETKDPGKENEDIKIPVIVDDNNSEQEDEESKKTISLAKKYKVIYLDQDGNQLGKTQTVLDLEDRVNERAPKVKGYRFSEWVLQYNKKENIYYYFPIYVQVVERIPVAEEPYLDEEKGETENTYKAEVVNAIEPGDPVIMDGEELIDEETDEPIVYANSIYVVEVTGEVEELEPEDISEDLTIDEEYSHIIGLRFNAPEDVTKENIENMTIDIHTSYMHPHLDESQYHYNGEDNGVDPVKVGRDLLDSTDEEYENDIFYFYYYQEADTKTNSIVEVYWGNDPEADAEATPDPIEPKQEYVEIYAIDLENVELENEVLVQ